MKPLVSIIIPVYNVEKYLDKCIASVVNQTYTNLEIILVDDGSLDNCPAICDQWQAKDSRIKVIHQQNGGLSKARNEGLKLATGEFIGFVDSDDWIELEMYEKLLSAIEETGADIAVCNLQEEPPKNKVVQSKRESLSKKLYSSEEALKLIFQGRCINIFVWNKLYRKTVLANITFPDDKIYEDNLWTVKIIGNANLIVSIDSILYHYVYRPESLSRNNQQLWRRISDKIDMREERIEYIQTYYPKLKKYAIQTLQNFCCWEYIDINLNFRHLDANGEIRQKLLQHFWQYSPIYILDLRNIGKAFTKILVRMNQDLPYKKCF